MNPGRTPAKCTPKKETPAQFTTGGGGRPETKVRQKWDKNGEIFTPEGGGEGRPFFYRHTTTPPTQEDHRE